MGDLFSFVTNYLKGTVCAWTLDSASADICGMGMGGLPLVIGIAIVALFFGPLKDAAAGFVQQRPVAMVAIAVLVGEIFLFRDLIATLLGVALLTAFLIFSSPLSRYRLALAGRTVRLSDALLVAPPAVFLATVAVALMVQTRPAVTNATILLIPSPLGDRASVDLQKYLRQVRVNLTEQLTSFDILPSLDGIDKFPEYIAALSHSWNDLPQKLDRFGLARRQSVELLRTTWETFKYKDDAAIKLSVERRSYDPQARHISGATARLSIFGPKDPNATVFSLLVSYEVVSHHLAASKIDEAKAASTFTDWFREFGQHLTERLEPSLQTTLEEGCKTLKCLDPIVSAYTSLLLGDYKQMRQAAAPEALRTLKAGAKAAEGLVGPSK